MAIYSAVPPPPELGGPPIAQQDGQQQPQPPGDVANQPSATAVDIEAWTVSALQSLSVSPTATGTGGTPLSIPLDGNAAIDNVKAEGVKKTSGVSFYDARNRSSAVTPPPRPHSARDSQRRREALLKGKEGSRQRRRWENDRLINVPNAQPPEPVDFLPRPTHRVVHVQYHLAAAWDLNSNSKETTLRAGAEARRAAAARRKQTQTRTLGDAAVAGRVPRELFVRAKKNPAMKGWVRMLEEPVRRYLVDSGVNAEDRANGGLSDDEGDSTEDEEIVFVGRNGSMRDGWKRARRGAQVATAAGGGVGKNHEDGLLIDDRTGLGDDAEGSSFQRWITHSISDYYGLESHSVMVGEPKRKVVYVAARHARSSAVTAGKADEVRSLPTCLPRPLWQLC